MFESCLTHCEWKGSFEVAPLITHYCLGLRARRCSVECLYIIQILWIKSLMIFSEKHFDIFHLSDNSKFYTTCRLYTCTSIKKCMLSLELERFFFFIKQQFFTFSPSFYFKNPVPWKIDLLCGMKNIIISTFKWESLDLDAHRHITIRQKIYGNQSVKTENSKLRNIST